ncbi:MAG: SDR family oxidoreductase [Haliscomenobacter sp.]|nr:SDR family oxidoreductase [Haliscomenobacter sp.]MBK8879544.1 SDR family oxidoreductase [Haliscomenobacter sp.]
MHNKTVLITGGNSGIGKFTALGLLQEGAEVFIACRNREKAAKAIQELESMSAVKGKVRALELDLADLHSIEAMVLAFQAQRPKLDVLINNAGVVTSKYQQTRQGFELQFGVNHLGHFHLTQLLLPALREAPEARVVNVSSASYLRGTLDFNRLRQWPGRYNSLKAYAQSKLCNVLFTREMARRHPEIDCNALHPGVVSTEIGSKHMTLLEALAWTLYRPFMVSPKTGAKTSIFLASSPTVAGISGRFFDENQNPRKLAAHALSDTLAQRLWTESEQWTKKQ